MGATHLCQFIRRHGKDGTCQRCQQWNILPGIADDLSDCTEHGNLPGLQQIFSTTVNVDSEYRSHQLRQTFRERPDVIYRGILALLSGKVDYLFDK